MKIPETVYLYEEEAMDVLAGSDTKIAPEKLYLDFAGTSNTELDKIRVNASNNGSLSEGNSLSANMNIQLTRKLNNRGRNVTLRAIGSYGEN